MNISSLLLIPAIFLTVNASLLPANAECPSNCHCEDTSRWVGDAKKQIKTVKSCSLPTTNKLTFRYGVTIKIECENNTHIGNEELDTIKTVINFNKEDFGIIEIEGCDLPDVWIRNATKMFELSNLALNVIRISPKTTFGSEAFKGTTGVLSVTLAPTYAKLPSKLFADLKALAIEVIMEDAQIEQVDVPEDLFWGTGSLERVELRFPIKVLPENIFRDQKNVTDLSLYMCGLTEIKPALFSNLENVGYLRLDRNKLLHLPEKVFSGLKKLRDINLEDNSISSIAYNAFEGAASTLEVLNLANNLLTLPTPDTNPACSPALSQIMPNLKSLNLINNRITELSSHCGPHLFGLFTNIDDGTNASASMTELTVNIGYNKYLKTVFSWWRGEKWNLRRKVSLDMNEVPLICDCDFYNTAVQANSYKNSLRMEFTCEQPKKLAGYTIDEVQDELYCDKIKDCPEQCSCSAHPARSLLKLECSVVPRQVPSAPVKLVSLALNPAPASLPRLSPKITELVLADLNLKELPSLRSLLEVETVDVRKNNLTGILPEQYLDRFNFLLEGNPIACDCDHLEEVQLLQKYKKKVLDYSKLQCREGTILSQIVPDLLCVKPMVSSKN